MVRRIATAVIDEHRLLVPSDAPQQSTYWVSCTCGAQFERGYNDKNQMVMYPRGEQAEHCPHNPDNS